MAQDVAARYDSRAYALRNRWDPTHLQTVDRLLPLRDGDRVLEVGCGVGHLTKRLAARGVDVVGIDANPNATRVACTELVRTMLAQDLAFADGSFDALVSVHAIEHIPPLPEALAEMARVLRPGGRAPFFIYPAELVRGMFAIPTSVILHGTPFRAREVHCHKLWPAKLRGMVAPLGLVEDHAQFKAWRSPQFVSRYVKSG